MSWKRKPFLRLTTDGATDHSGGDERYLLVMDRDPVPMCITSVMCCCYVVYWLSIVCCKSMEPLCFDRPAESDVVRRFPTYAKVFASTAALDRVFTKWERSSLIPFRSGYKSLCGGRGSSADVISAGLRKDSSYIQLKARHKAPPNLSCS